MQSITEEREVNIHGSSILSHDTGDSKKIFIKVKDITAYAMQGYILATTYIFIDEVKESLTMGEEIFNNNILLAQEVDVNYILEPSGELTNKVI